MNSNTYVVTNKCDGIEYADKYFKTYEQAKEYADSLTKRYSVQYKPSDYEVLIVIPE